jgi:non-heme chloroperoxidase
MGTITTRDGTEIFYKDWDTGQPVVFSHGWPLTADAWDLQMMFLGERGCRVVAYDRRGHGRTSQPWSGNDLDTYADDLAELREALDLRDIVLIGHSTGGGEVTRRAGEGFYEVPGSHHRISENASDKTLRAYWLSSSSIPPPRRQFT